MVKELSSVTNLTRTAKEESFFQQGDSWEATDEDYEFIYMLSLRFEDAMALASVRM
jgi:hypothetical protein